MPKVVISFSLDSDRDKDIIDWYKSVENRCRSKAIRDVLRTRGITLADIYDVVLELKQRSVVVKAKADSVSSHDDEPDDMAAALDSLGL